MLSIFKFIVPDSDIPPSSILPPLEIKLPSTKFTSPPTSAKVFEGWICKPNPKELEKIANLQEPHDLKSLKRFLGMTSWQFREHDQRFVY